MSHDDWCQDPNCRNPTQGLPAVGKPVDIVWKDGSTMRDRVVCHDSLGFGITHALYRSWRLARALLWANQEFWGPKGFATGARWDQITEDQRQSYLYQADRAIEFLARPIDEEIAKLRDWKESAMRSLRESDLVAVEALRGQTQIPLGSSLNEEAIKAIRAMRDELARVKAENGEWKVAHDSAMQGWGKAASTRDELLGVLSLFANGLGHALNNRQLARKLLDRLDAERAGRKT